MNTLTGIYNFLYIDNSENYDQEVINRILLMNFFAGFGMLATTGFGIWQLLIENYFYAVILILTAAISFLSITISRRSKNLRLTSNLIIITYTLMLAFTLVSKKTDGSSLLWLVPYPFIAGVFFGKRLGMIYSLGFLLFTFIFFLLPVPEKHEYIQYYPIGTKVRFLIISIGVNAFTAFFIYIRENSVRKHEKEFIETEKRLKEKDNFISRLSFQMRTPLSNIVGILNLNETENDDAKAIEQIKMPINNMITIVNSIPEFSASKIRQIKHKKVNFDIRRAVRNTIKLFRNQNYKALRFNITFSEDLSPKVYGDLLTNKQIFISLIDLIYKYKSDSSILIDFFLSQRFKSPPGIAFEISGKLLPEYAQYFKEKEEKVFPELAIIKEMIKTQEGTFKYEIKGNRVRFLFTLIYKPAAETEIKNRNRDLSQTETKLQSNSQSASRDKYEETVVLLKNAKILLVEDDKVNQKIMMLSLRKHVKTITLAENGKEALDLFTTSKFDIILMDIRMPVMDGLKAAKKIRQTEVGSSSRTPIIAVTANAFTGDREKCLDAGMDDYVSKPFQIDELMKTMKKHLG